MDEFYGGDLPGVEARLDYLTELGVNAIYLNPVFSAYSNHRYDVVDYENVDPHPPPMGWRILKKLVFRTEIEQKRTSTRGTNNSSRGNSSYHFGLPCLENN